MKPAASRLIGDPFVQAGTIVFALAIVFLAATAYSPGFAGTRFGALFEPLLTALTLGALLWGRARLAGSERRFWELLAAAWVCLLLVDLFFFLELPLPVVGTNFAIDLLHILFYLAFVLAIDFRPHLPVAISPSSARRQLESVAGLLVAFGLLIYFAIVVLPEPLGLSLAFVGRDQGLAPFLLTLLTLDILILGRLVWGWFGSEGRWRWIYALLGTAALVLSLKDAFSLAQIEGLMSLEILGIAYEAFLYLPVLLVLTAARYARLSIGELETQELSTSKAETEGYHPSRLVLYALLVPVVHFFLYTVNLLDPESRAPREAFCLAYMAVLGSMAWIHQGMITRDTRRAQRALREARERSSRSDRLEAIGRLSGGIAHDFNNYLTVIQGYGELIQSRLPEDTKHEFGLIQDAADRAGELTRQLLAFGGRQILRPMALDLNEIVTSMGAMLQRLLGEDIELVFDLDPEVEMISADQGQTEQIFVNLAINSRDAMPRGGTLTVSTRPVSIDIDTAAALSIEPGAYGELTVRDTGHGMTEEVRSRIFEPFFTTKELGRGTGLGLSTVYGIVSQSGGAIDVHSAVDVGTSVHVLLPCTGALEQREETVPVPADLDHIEATVLLVEDEESVRSLAQRALEESGFDVLVAGGGEQALDLQASHAGDLDLVITDVMMPGMDGLELVAQLEERLPGIPVLLISGYPLETLRERRAELPAATPLLHKPFTASSFVRAVLEALEAKHRE